jgi:hypothetical protein
MIGLSSSASDKKLMKAHRLLSTLERHADHAAAVERAARPGSP